MKYAFHPFFLNFKNAQIEESYRKDNFDKIIEPIRVILIVAGIIFFVAWAFNAFVRAEQPDITSQVLIEIDFFNDLLLYALVPTCVALYLMSFMSKAMDLYQFGAGLISVLVVISSIGMVFSTSDLTAQHFSFGFLLINTWVIYTVSQLRYLYATFICLTGFLVYIVLLFYRFEDPLYISATYIFLLGVTNFLGPIASYQVERTSRMEYVNRQVVDERERELALEKQKSEKLLLNMLPETIAQRLKSNPERIADRCDNVTVLFADIVGFTDRSSTMPADDLEGFLDEVFTKFDTISEHYQVEKIKTIGDAYMVAAGVPLPLSDHASRIADFALEILSLAQSLRWPDGSPMNLRIGINSGPAVAGVIGRQKYIYDLWGDTVNTASRMESQGMVGEIQLTESSYKLLEMDYELVERGEVQVKGKGAMPTWLLKARKSSSL